jgi:hypothetical protein
MHVHVTSREFVTPPGRSREQSPPFLPLSWPSGARNHRIINPTYTKHLWIRGKQRPFLSLNHPIHPNRWIVPTSFFFLLLKYTDFVTLCCYSRTVRLNRAPTKPATRPVLRAPQLLCNPVRVAGLMESNEPRVHLNSERHRMMACLP